MKSLVLLVLVALPATAFAEAPAVKKAQRAYSRLRFDDVLKAVDEGRKAGPLSKEDDVELTRLEAYTYSVFDDEPRAVAAFERLLRLSPSFTLKTDESPKIRKYFAEARASVKPLLTDQQLGRAPKPAGDTTPPFYKSGWFWGAVAVTAAAVVGVGIVVDRESTPAPRGSLGTLELP